MSKVFYSRIQFVVGQVNHILKISWKDFHSKKRRRRNSLRSGVIPLENDDDDESDSSKPLLELNKRCFESTSFRDELKNFANVDIVEIYEEK